MYRGAIITRLPRELVIFSSSLVARARARLWFQPTPRQGSTSCYCFRSRRETEVAETKGMKWKWTVAHADIDASASRCDYRGQRSRAILWFLDCKRLKEGWKEGWKEGGCKPKSLREQIKIYASQSAYITVRNEEMSPVCAQSCTLCTKIFSTFSFGVQLASYLDYVKRIIAVLFRTL